MNFERPTPLPKEEKEEEASLVQYEDFEELLGGGVDIYELSKSLDGGSMESKRLIYEGIQQVIEYGDPLGRGQHGEVYKDVPMHGNEGFIAIKKIVQKNKKGENTPLMELVLQGYAHKVLSAWQEENPETPIARVPRPSFYFKNEKGEEYVGMDQVQGKDLFRMVLERAHTMLKEKGAMGEEGPVSALDDDDLVRSVWREIGGKESELEKASYGGVMERIVREVKMSQFLPKVIMEQMKNGIKNLPVRHCALHPKNVMIDKDGAQAYIIDFGTAKTKKEYEWEMLEAKDVAPDEAILASLELLVVGGDDEKRQTIKSFDFWKREGVTPASAAVLGKMGDIVTLTELSEDMLLTRLRQRGIRDAGDIQKIKNILEQYKEKP